ncbi:hypothetical protein NFHSH190041_18390 [Shewanella sp. NFH-SH190041]|uniref:DUF4303 domain-containing protein n=1 Tax=Shewanella sp. NFH-SH190041 TaxID=2950245 RepID=UPI0021C44BDE|nr:DUF4303 domain-containing protein [Shewanella sp. NFH-SH190041]BDM64387.1 hypothetical protein NFHSH190041_18390 [Shewanella sp. NFH-SH190041]
MKLIDKNELVNSLYESAIPCLESFFKEHEGECFFGFAVEILAEEGYFHIGANSLESFQLTIDSYSQSGESMESIMGEEIKWNNQEWEYFNLNYDSDIWENLWNPTLTKIDAYKKYIRTLGDQEWEKAQEDFSSDFEAAGREAFNKIISSGILDKVKKTQDFRAFVFEHHEVF